MKWIITSLAVLIVALLIMLFSVDTPSLESEIFVESDEIKVTSNGLKYIVDPSDIKSGGPPKDGIPSIDSPDFVSVLEADKWISDNELVLALEYNGEKRVYPLQIMVWHEIVNDVVSGDALLITYCPLCGSGIAYSRLLNGSAVEFGTSGKLYNSNLVMYDRLTESYWTQIEGQGIVGKFAGYKLKPISIDTVTWRDWKYLHPESLVLSQETGYDRDYGRDPYGSYYEDSLLFFPVKESDDSIHPKTVIYGVEIDGVFKAYIDDDVNETIVDSVNGVPLRIERLEDGRIEISRINDSLEIVKERGFWFSWYAFHPDTLVYGR